MQDRNAKFEALKRKRQDELDEKERQEEQEL